MTRERWFLLISAGVFVLLFLILMYIGHLTAWMFFGMLFYLALYGFGYLFVVKGWEKDVQEDELKSKRKKKFEWCWQRVNQILRSMPGGEGIRWDKGRGTTSFYKELGDGIQNKPFRSILGYLYPSRRTVLIIYDIDNDDIKTFTENVSVEQIENHFYGFDPFNRSSSSFSPFSNLGGGFDTPSRYADAFASNNMRTPQYGNVSPQNDPEERERIHQIKTTPDPDGVDAAVKRIKLHRN